MLDDDGFCPHRVLSGVSCSDCSRLELEEHAKQESDLRRWKSCVERALADAGNVPTDGHEGVRQLTDQRDLWRKLALHALHDLMFMGIPVSKIIDMTNDVLVSQSQRSATREDRTVERGA